MNTKHYLRLLRTFALAALTAAATAACSDDTDNDREPLTPPDGNGGIPVTFTANINPGSDADPAGAPDTRTVLTPDGGGFTVEWKGKDNNDLYDCDQIFIWATKGETVVTANNGYPAVYVPTISAVSSALVPFDESLKLILPEPGEWTFTATYGVDFDNNNCLTIDMPSQFQSKPNNTDDFAEWDFSVATATQTIEAGEMPQSISLKFEHKLSALQLHVTNETGADVTIREIRLAVVGEQIANERTYDIAAGDWKTTGERKSDNLPLFINTPAALASDGTAQDFHMLLFPGYENKTLTITVITSRGEYSLTKPAPDGGFIPGKNYMTDITLRTSGLTDKEKWVEYISNKAELIAFRERVNDGIDNGKLNARLTSDIDLTGETWTQLGAIWGKFRGTFDGDGHHINGLMINNSMGYVGLFGCIYGGTVRNLRVSGTVETGENCAGGIVGRLESNSTIENCIFSGDVSSRHETAGGIAGACGSSRIIGCYAKGKVTASSEVGGIVGSSSGTITDCYSGAEVKASGRAGGVVGVNRGSITRCYAMGNVSSPNNAGGIVGWNNDGTVTVSHCIALNPSLTRTSGGGVSFGQIVGENNGGTFTSCAAFAGMMLTDGTSDFSADATGEHGDALTREQCLTEVTYTGREFTTDNGWAFDNGATWTYLPWNKIFDSWNISETEYRIALPDHLKAPVIP